MKHLILKCPIGQTTVLSNSENLTEESLNQFLLQLSIETGHVYKCRFSVNNDKIAISVDDILINKTGLIERWSKSLPNKFFKEPTIISRNPKFGSIEHLYSLAEAIRIEQTSDFKVEYEKIRNIQIGQGLF